ncbi:unnamed protein product [Amoebophrya sp. A120]|nr:unnamed protein product [Amoebophrya sp. A120]|eukprot:GSA120T00026115001.1
MTPPRGFFTFTLCLRYGLLPWRGAGELAPTLLPENVTDAFIDRSPHSRYDDSQQVRTVVVDTAAEFTDEEERAGESGFVEKSISGDSSAIGELEEAPSTTKIAADDQTEQGDFYRAAGEKGLQRSGHGIGADYSEVGTNDTESTGSGVVNSFLVTKAGASTSISTRLADTVRHTAKAIGGVGSMYMGLPTVWGERIGDLVARGTLRGGKLAIEAVWRLQEAIREKMMHGVQILFDLSQRKLQEISKKWEEHKQRHPSLAWFAVHVVEAEPGALVRPLADFIGTQIADHHRKFSLWTHLQKWFWEDLGVLNSIQQLHVVTDKDSYRELKGKSEAGDTDYNKNLVFENHAWLNSLADRDREDHSAPGLDRWRKAELYRTMVFAKAVYEANPIDAIKKPGAFLIESAAPGVTDEDREMKDHSGRKEYVDDFSNVDQFAYYIDAKLNEPAYMILRDDLLQAIVVVIQGTAGPADIRTDLHYGDCWVPLADFGVGNEKLHHHSVDHEKQAVEHNPHHPAVHKHPDPQHRHSHDANHICTRQKHKRDKQTHSVNEMVRVHAGFFKAAHYVSFKTFKLVHNMLKHDEHEKYKRVIITGHSLGAATAQFVYAMWRGTKAFHDIDHARKKHAKKANRDHHPIEVKCYAHANPGMISTHAQVHHLKEQARKGTIKASDLLFPFKSFLTTIAGYDVVPRVNYPERLKNMADAAFAVLSTADTESENWNSENSAASDLWTAVDTAQSEELKQPTDAKSGGALPSGQLVLYLPGPPEPAPPEESHVAGVFGFAIVHQETFKNPIFSMKALLSHDGANYIAKLAKLFVSTPNGLLRPIARDSMHSA